ncbi:MAG: tripartite tricarboxylate transporter TctB family protein [Synergistales bacterium]|jgi:putative tricarboxylic transport membrane protein
MRPNALVGFTAIFIGVVYAVQALHLPKAMIGNPWAPVYFPVGLGILMAALGLLLVALEARKGLTNLEGVKRPKFQAASLKLIFGAAALCILYALLFEHAGFILSTLVFLGALLFLINGPRAWKLNGALTLGFTFSAWYTFVKLFQINLP